MQDLPSDVNIKPGEAAIQIGRMKTGAFRFAVRGENGIYFDWIGDNAEREKIIDLLLLDDEAVVKKSWYHKLRFWRGVKELRIRTELQ